jgi:hypothetical protein
MSVAQQWMYANYIENTSSFIVVFTARFHSNGSCPIVAFLFVVAYCCRFYLTTGGLTRIRLRGNVFITPLPSNGHMRHNILEYFLQYRGAGILIGKTEDLSLIPKVREYFSIFHIV